MSNRVPYDGLFVVIFFKTKYNKTITGFWVFPPLGSLSNDHDSRQRQQKRYPTESVFVLLQTSRLRFFQELISKGLYLSSQKENRCHVFPSSIKVMLHGTIRYDDF